LTGPGGLGRYRRDYCVQSVLLHAAPFSPISSAAVTAAATMASRKLLIGLLNAGRRRLQARAASKLFSAPNLPETTASRPLASAAASTKLLGGSSAALLFASRTISSTHMVAQPAGDAPSPASSEHKFVFLNLAVLSPWCVSAHNSRAVCKICGSLVSKEILAELMTCHLRTLNRWIMPEGEFHKLADETIHDLLEKLEEYGDSVQMDGFDIDYGNQVLTLRLGDLGTYVVNKQTPNRQIWLSSPVSGPSRFDWDAETSSWIYKRTGAKLVHLLEKEIGELCGTPVELS
ncbi:hypothetical protein EJB05_16735, partial [Eragrostis curvula]